jgi:hypothetical protein
MVRLGSFSEEKQNRRKEEGGRKEGRDRGW